MRLNKFLSGLAAVLLAFSLCNAASAAPLTKIRTAWMDSYETFAMWYAKEKGWDKEAGLDIDILFFDSGMAILNALPAGEWQYSCLGGVPAMMGNLRYGTSVIGVGTDESALRRRARPARQSRLQEQGPQSQASRRIREPRGRAGQDHPLHHGFLRPLRAHRVA